MKKSKLIALLLVSMVVFSATSSFAQDSTFKLSNYQNPNYFYQTLDLNFGLNSGSSINKSDNISDFYNLNSYSMSLNARAAYSSYANSVKSQSELYVSIYGSIRNSGQHNTFDLENTEYRQKNFSNNESFNFSGLKRFYDAKQNYFEVNGFVSSAFSNASGTNKSYSSDTISNSTSYKTNNNVASLEGSLLIGKGRLEQVQDARLALYFWEDMHRLNRDKRSVTNEEVLELARLITSLKYKRFFDSRLKKIADITAIDSFMQKHGLVNITDAAYFTSLNDNWNYSNNPARESGYRIYTGIEGHYQFNSNKNHREILVPAESISDQKYNANQAEAYAVAGLVYEKPLNLKWQQSASVKASVGYKNQLNKYEETGMPDTSRYNGSIPSLGLRAQYGYGFYPNSRTWLTAGWYLNSTYNKQFIGTSKNDTQNSQNNFYTYTGPIVQAYYYISEKLRLSVNFNCAYQVNVDKFITNIPKHSTDKQTDTHWGYELDASLTYNLF